MFSLREVRRRSLQRCPPPRRLAMSAQCSRSAGLASRSPPPATLAGLGPLPDHDDDDLGILSNVTRCPQFRQRILDVLPDLAAALTHSVDLLLTTLAQLDNHRARRRP